MTQTLPTFEIPGQVAKIAALLQSGQRFFFSTHVYPDGDNLGSMTALMHALESLGKECYAYVGTKIPDYYSFLPDVERLVHNELPGDTPDDYDACIIVDSGDINRMGQEFTDWKATGTLPLINIDHHKSNDLFGDVVWVDATYAAVGEQIVELLDALGVAITPEIATCLMCSIMTDTGRFSYENVTLRTMTYTTRLVAAGITTHSVFAPIYQAKKLSGLMLQNLAMNTMQIDKARKFAWLWITQEMLAESGALLEESEGFIDVVNAVKEIETVCFIKEANQGDFKLSIRTKGAMDAVPLAQLFGGGGHARAAGSSLPGANIDEVLANILGPMKQNIDQQRKAAVPAAAG